MFLTIAPIVLAGVVGDARCRPSSRPRSSPSGPSGRRSRRRELAGAFAVQQFLAFFLLMPAYIPLSIATFSIIGEKQARTLEPVLADPDPDRRAARRPRRSPRSCPGSLAGWATYVVFVALASVVYGPTLFGVVTDACWLAGVFVLGPAVGLSSVVAGVIVSARVNDPRVAQQIGGIIIVPIIAVTLLQATGTLLVGRVGYILLAAIILVVSLIGLRSACAVRPGGDPDPLAVTAVARSAGSADGACGR